MVTLRVRSMVWFATGVVLAVFATVLVMQTWRVDAAPGDVDSTFVPIDPCRLIDTRQPGQTAFTAQETRTLTARGTNGACTIPPDAVGVSMNMTALDASAVTFVTVWPGGTFPTASSLNPAPGQPPTPNAVTTTLSGSGTFNVYNDAGTVGLIIDINGYYTKGSLSEIVDRLRSIENSRSFAVTNRPPSPTSLVAEERVVVSVTLTASTGGQVTVLSNMSVEHLPAGNKVTCTITRGTVLNRSYEQVWKAPADSHLSGSRTFDIAAGQTVTYNLVCLYTDPAGSFFTNPLDPELTAIFSPAP